MKNSLSLLKTAHDNSDGKIVSMIKDNMILQKISSLITVDLPDELRKKLRSNIT